ncbi:uncharacterized protein isoform X1 [Leptinotarsa decemlineata]|uniref:uncharacterized protein isoform X1 n=1 Tax=Leptinotarsa decemlineata TaxID=7539 RepID=UPI003D30982F
MKYMIFLVVLLVVGAVTSAPSREVVTLSMESRSQPKFEIQQRSDSSPGIVNVLEAIITLLTNFLGFLDGRSTIEDLVSAIQNLFFTVQKMINVEWFVRQIPFVGSYLGPMVGGVGTILEDSGMLGGLISQVLVGPTYPKSVQPPPRTLPKSENNNGGSVFGGWLG